MPKVHFVKSARVANEVADVGESYYWWKFAFGAKRYSKIYPNRSQLTQSGFLQELYALEDSLQDLEATEPEDIENAIGDITGQIEELIDQCTESLDNMPEHLQETSESGILLQERIDALEDWKGEIEGIDTEVEEGLGDEERQKRIDGILAELKDCQHSLGCPLVRAITEGGDSDGHAAKPGVTSLGK